MQFTSRKRRQAPAVIIVALIDVLLVVLIFLIVSTTFKNQPAMKLALPVSSQTKDGVSENPALVVSIAKSGSNIPLHLGTQPVTFEKLEERLLESARSNPNTTLSIRADTDAPFGMIVKIMDAAKAANIKTVSAFTSPKN
ncbi:MAG: biopolymer transporter ExbD [Verrucomicrobia bacterium]|nr:biopolymer transporter ExbD [Verrucomicrobiota bacterium]